LKSKFINVLVGVAVIAGLMLVPAVLPAVPAGVALALNGVTISIEPPLKKVGFNEPFSFDVVVDNPGAMPIGNADVRLHFDPTYFNVTNMVNGDMPFNFGQSWDNVTGIIKSGPYMASGTNTTATSILLCTVNCLSKDASGESTVAFLYQAGPPPLKTVVIYGATDYLEGGDMSLMYNGTVKAGKATLNIAVGMDMIFQRTTANYSCLLPGLYANNVTEYRMPMGANTARVDFCPWANRMALSGAVPVQMKAMVVTTDAFGDFVARTVYLNAWTGGPSWLETSLVQNFVYDAMPHGAPYTVGKTWTYNSTMYLPDMLTWENGTYSANVTSWEMVSLNAGCGVPVALPCFKVVRTNTNGTATPADDYVSGIDWYADPLYAGALGNMVVKQVEYELFAPNPDTSVLSGVGMPAGQIEIKTDPNAGNPGAASTQWAWDTVVELEAHAAPGYTFSHWNGDLVCSTANPETITMSEDKTVIAMFCELPPVIGVDPALGFVGPNKFTARYDMENPDNQTLTITNTGGGTLAWSATDDAGWLSMDVISGNLTVGQSDVSIVSVDSLTGPMAVGTHWANITITGSTVVVPVELEIQEATTISVMRDLPGNNLLPDETYPGDQFTVYVNFTSPTADFNAISVVDQAPAGWTVDTNKTWCTPAADRAINRDTNVAEITWHGIYAKDTNFSAVYKVTVPNTAAPGINLFPLDDCGLAWVGYHFGAEPWVGEYSSCISDEYKMLVTVPGVVWGETRDVNADLLDTVLVTLYEEPLDANPEDSCSSAQPSAVYENDVDDTGEYWQRAEKWCYHTLDMDAMPGSRNPSYPLLINLTTPVLLADGYNIDFEGDYGLVPVACDVTYAMESVNKANFVPKDEYGVNHTEWRLTSWKAMESVNAWTNPENCV